MPDTIHNQAAPDEVEADQGQLDLRVWLRLFACTSLMEAHVRKNLREQFESTLPRFDLLSQLHRKPDGLTMGELSRLLMVSNGNVTGLIERLVSEGMVDRWHDPADRRVMRVRLTERGRRAFEAMAPANRQWISAMMAGLSRAEMKQLANLLEKLKGSVQAAGHE